MIKMYLVQLTLLICFLLSHEVSSWSKTSPKFFAPSLAARHQSNSNLLDSSLHHHVVHTTRLKTSIPYSFFRLYHNPSKASDFSLGQRFPIVDFLTQFDSDVIKPVIAGVFILSNQQNEALVVESSTDILKTLYQELRQRTIDNQDEENEESEEKVQFYFDVSKYNRVQAQSTSAETVGNTHLVAVDNIRVQTLVSATEQTLQMYQEEVRRQSKPRFTMNAIADGIVQDTKDITSPFSSTEKPIETKVEPSKAPLPEFLPIDDSDEVLELNFANVDRVLDKVRPYLVADGGNVAVVEVNVAERVIKLTLQGACGSCPSSTTTMKMGIERVLKEHFENIQDIIAISPEEASKLSIEKVKQSLEKILPAITGLGGSLKVSKVEEDTGKVYVEFQGPDRLKKGVQLVIMDTPNVKEVIFI